MSTRHSVLLERGAQVLGGQSRHRVWGGRDWSNGRFYHVYNIQNVELGPKDDLAGTTSGLDMNVSI